MADIYKQLYELEQKYNTLHAKYLALKREVDDLLCEIEVDHFLEYGPGLSTDQ